MVCVGSSSIRVILLLFFLLVSFLLKASTSDPFQSPIGDVVEWRLALEDSLSQIKDEDVDNVMKSHLSRVEEEANLAWYYYLWGKRMLRVDRAKSMSLFNEGIKYSQKAGQLDLEARYCMTMSDVLPIPELGERERLLSLADSLLAPSQDYVLKLGVQQRLAVLYAQAANPVKNQFHRDRALEMLDHVDDVNAKASFYMNMSIFLQKFIGADTALYYLTQASALDSIFPITKAKIYFQKAKLNAQLGQFDSVAINVNKSYSIFLDLDDPMGIRLTLQLMSRNYANQGFYDKAIALGPKLRKYIPKESLFGYYYDIGNFSMIINDLKTAQLYLDSLEQVATEKSPFQLQALYTSFKGELGYKSGQKKEGLSNMFQAHKMFDERGLKDQALGAMYIFSRNYAKVLLNDSFISLPEHGINNETDLLQIFETITANEIEQGQMNFQSHVIFRAQGILYRKTGQPEKAFDYLLMGQARKDSIENEEKNKSVLEFSQKTKELEMAKTQAELQAKNAANKADRDRQRNGKLAITGVAVFLLIIAGLIFLQLRRNRTYTHQLEEQKHLIEEQRDQLADLDNLKSSFFANISHELRTPLTLILGPLTDIVKMRTRELPSDIGKMLKLAYRNGSKIRELVNEILDLGKLEVGELKVEYQAVELHSFSKRVLFTFESLATLKSVQLHFEYGLHHPQAYRIDKNKLDKILSNLLSNAIKFTRTNGNITLRVKEVGDTTTFEVIDDGAGIPTDELGKVFNRYYQSPSRKEGAGTGIGLSFAQQLASAMGGSLSVASQVDKGSTFTLAIPMLKTNENVELEPDLEEDVDEPQLDIIPEKLGADAAVLVVEDNPEMQQYLHATLSSHFEIVLADNGRKALEILENKRFDLILSDLMMPEMDGMELLEHVKSNAHWKNTPFVMLTALASDKDKFKALNVGLDDYLLKPFNSEELLVRINNLIANHKERVFDESEGSEDQQWLQSVQELTDLRLLDEDFSVATLADELGIIERQLYRKMKKLTGLTPNKFIQEMRLRRGRNYLETGTYKTLKEVSLAVGFDSYQYFSRLYEKRFGKKPTDYFR